MSRFLGISVTALLLLASFCSYSQSLGSSLVVIGGFQTGIADFVSNNEYTFVSDESPLYVAPYLAVGLKSGEGPWGFTFSVSSPIREFSFIEDLYRPGGPIVLVPFRDYTFRYFSLEGNLAYSINDKLSVFVGPNMQVKYGAYSYAKKVDYASSFIGLNAGAEIYLKRFVLGAFYASPLRSVDVFTSKMKYESVQLRFGYLIMD